MLLVTTPIGVAWGIVEAYRFHAWLALLMALLLSVISAFIWNTLRVIRRERAQQLAKNHHDAQA
jgi:F0F1-type ATP synthase membrane subunit b/b'